MGKLKDAILLGAVIIAVLFVAGFIGYGLGTRAAESKYNQIIAAARAESAKVIREYDARVAGLDEALGTTEARAGAVRDGLADVARIALAASDRNRRIAILIDGIDRALRELAIIGQDSGGSGATGGGP